MVFELKNLEVIQTRNKWGQECIPGSPDIDQTWYGEYFKRLTCKPPYLNGIEDLPPCETQNELNQVHREYFEYRLTSKASEVPPCRSLEKLEFSYFEYDIEEGKDPNVTISILFIDDRYREMLNIRAFDVHSLLGNIGGYVGIFIGCALLNLPDAIMKLIKIHRCVTCSKIQKLEEQMEQVL